MQEVATEKDEEAEGKCEKSYCSDRDFGEHGSLPGSVRVGAGRFAEGDSEGAEDCGEGLEGLPLGVSEPDRHGTAGRAWGREDEVPAWREEFAVGAGAEIVDVEGDVDSSGSGQKDQGAAALVEDGGG
ncbi:hypothetical protein, partial [Streptomyces sp. NPDC101166]|uniref:hypothetical protein n=1 Tax=Streptomyces sp. NPDC101166 TaxID=3366120 RepID=UPI003806D7D6